MFRGLLFGAAALSAAVFGSVPAQATADFYQSYSVTTGVDISHILTYNRYGSGSGSTNSFQIGVPGGVIVDPFLKSAANPPLLTYFLGVSTDSFSVDHLILALETGYASGLLGAGDDFSTTFPTFGESSLIGDLALLDTADLPVGDPGRAAQLAAKDAAFNEIFSFSDLVNSNGGLTSANGGSFSLLSYSSPSLVGAGTANLTPAAAVPEIGTWLMMIAGFGFVGASMRRRGESRRVAVLG